MKGHFGGRSVFSALAKSKYESSVGNTLFKTECNILKSSDRTRYKKKRQMLMLANSRLVDIPNRVKYTYNDS